MLARQTSGRLGVGLGIPWRVVGEVALGASLMLLAALGMSHILNDAADPLQLALDGGGGGLVGWVMGSLTSSLLGDLLVSVLLIALAGLGLWLALRALGVTRIRAGTASNAAYRIPLTATRSPFRSGHHACGCPSGPWPRRSSCVESSSRVEGARRRAR